MDEIREWNAELQQCRLDLEMKRKWEARLNRLDKDIKVQQQIAADCLQLLQKEEHDVERLTSSSFSHFWLGVLGNLDDKLLEEEREAVEAKLKYDAAQASLRGMEEELVLVKRQLHELQDADIRMSHLMERKETWIRDHDQTKRDELENLSEQIASSKARLVETEEARRAGESARQALMQAEDRLNSARSWGTYDMLGGGMISTMIKHGRIDEAQDHIHQSQFHLRQFAEELKDLDWDVQSGVPQIGGFLKFSDYFFDGFIADWMVQGKINDSLESVRTHTSQVSGILQKLDREKLRLESESARYHAQYEQLIERYGADGK
ncbi:MAG: hypothetical protein JWR03_1515 [Cohnella sp.]|jgi:hypothetical protein|nr:hypothetical protein [Cohnella sp.]